MDGCGLFVGSSEQLGVFLGFFWMVFGSCGIVFAGSGWLNAVVGILWVVLGCWGSL